MVRSDEATSPGSARRKRSLKARRTPTACSWLTTSAAGAGDDPDPLVPQVEEMAQGQVGRPGAVDHHPGHGEVVPGDRHRRPPAP